MGKIFSFDGWYYRTFTFLADVIILNVLFILTSMTVVLIGPALIALYRSMNRLLKNEGGSVVKTYLSEVKNNLKRGFILTAGVLVIAAVSLASVFIMMEKSRALGFLAVVVSTLVVLLLTILVMVFARLDLPFKQAAKEALYVLLSSTAHGIILFVIPALIFYGLGRVNLWLCVIVGFGASALVQTIFFNKVVVDDDGNN